MTWIPRLFAAAIAGMMLVGCSSSQAANTSGGSSSSGQCSEPCVLLHVTVNFTGLDNIQGSFVDTDSGAGIGSCAEYASGHSLGWVLGPTTAAGKATVIDGKTVNFGFSVTKDKFHGPGSYSSVLLANAVGVGADTFFGTNSTETLNADGSGQGGFSNLEGGSVTGAQGTESGTVTWTCSK